MVSVVVIEFCVMRCQPLRRALCAMSNNLNLLGKCLSTTSLVLFDCYPQSEFSSTS